MNSHALLRYGTRVLVAALLALSHSVPAAESTNSPPAYVLSVATDRRDAIYHQDEKVSFAIKLLHDSKPVDDAMVQWIVTKDGVPPRSKGELKLTNGTATVTGQLDEPGFLQCRVTFRADDKHTVTAYAGAGIDPEQIKPSLPVPDDFDAFWAAQKKKLAAVPVNARLTQVKSPAKNVDCFDVQADSIGASVSGYFALPADAKPKSLPIILTVHGAGVVSSSLGGATGWAKKGFLAVDMNAHGITNGLPDKYYSDLFAGELKEYYLRGRESRETVYFLGMFLRLMRAIDFLTARAEWDGRTVVVHGVSQGGAQSIAAAGLDPRVTFFAAGVPAMCDRTGSAVERTSGWPKLVPKGADGSPDTNVLQVARYYDCVNFARRTRADGIVTVGFVDTACPPTTVYAMYNALATKNQIINEPTMAHQVSKEAVEAMRQAILEHANIAVKETKK